MCSWRMTPPSHSLVHVGWELDLSSATETLRSLDKIGPLVDNFRPDVYTAVLHATSTIAGRTIDAKGKDTALHDWFEKRKDTKVIAHLRSIYINPIKSRDVVAVICIEGKYYYVTLVHSGIESLQQLKKKCNAGVFGKAIELDRIPVTCTAYQKKGDVGRGWRW